MDFSRTLFLALGVYSGTTGERDVRMSRLCGVFEGEKGFQQDLL